jgi:heterodisulfide reductase subunit A
MSAEPKPVVRIDPALCTGCRICQPLCPFDAIRRDEQARIAWVVEALCEGCGACVAACPSKALKQDAFSDASIIGQIEGFFSEE